MSEKSRRMAGEILIVWSFWLTIEKIASASAGRNKRLAPLIHRNAIVPIRPADLPTPFYTHGAILLPSSKESRQVPA